MCVCIELRRRLEHNVLKELKNTQRPNFLSRWCSAGRGVRIILIIEREGEASVSKLDHRNTQGPHVRLDGILGSLDSFRLWLSVGVTYAHIGARSHEGIGNAVDEFARYTKVAELDLAAAIHQNVTGFDISVDNPK